MCKIYYYSDAISQHRDPCEINEVIRLRWSNRDQQSVA